MASEDSSSSSSASAEAMFGHFLDFVVPGVLLVGVGALGLAGNVLSAVVLSRPQMSR